MPTKRLSQVFKELPFEKKLLGIGSLMLVVSMFLPWYRDLDSFNTGDMFLGVTGPLYLMGYSMLLIGVLNLVFMGMEFMGRKLPFLNFKFSSFYFLSGIAAFSLLLLVNSIYFHSKFGINITLKQSQFGMFFAFIASSFITVGGYLTSRDKASLLKEFEDKARDPFIELPKQEKPKESLRQEKKTVKTSVPEQVEIVEPAATVDVVQASEPATEYSEPKSPSQPFRTDL